jgi:hypothetical protein
MRGDQDLLATFATGGARLDLWLHAIGAGVARDATGAGAPQVAGDPSASWVIAAEAPANPASETMALLLRSCRASSALFAAVFHPHRGQPGVRSVAWSQEGDVLRCEAQSRGAAERWEIPLQPDGRPTRPRLQRQRRSGEPGSR